MDAVGLLMTLRASADLLFAAWAAWWYPRKLWPPREWRRRWRWNGLAYVPVEDDSDRVPHG